MFLVLTSGLGLRYLFRLVADRWLSRPNAIHCGLLFSAGNFLLFSLNMIAFHLGLSFVAFVWVC